MQLCERGLVLGRALLDPALQVPSQVIQLKQARARFILAPASAKR
jgi:hypothetical protein